MYKNTWVIVANGSKARFFQASSNEDLKEVETFIHEETRMKGEELSTDKPGRVFDSVGSGRHSVGNPKDLKAEEETIFARQIATRFEQHVDQHQINQLFIVASPHFLGELQKSLKDKVKKKIQGTINKDLTSQKPAEIRKYLPLVF